MRLQRDNAGLVSGPRAHRALDVGKRHCTYLALVLCQDDIRRHCLEPLGVDLVNRQTQLDQVANAAIDLGAGLAVHLEFRLRELRQIENRRWPVALVRARDLGMSQPKRMHDFRGTRDEGDDAGVGHKNLRSAVLAVCTEAKY